MFKKVRFEGFEQIAGATQQAMKFGQYILDNQVIKDSNYYVPTDQHYLEKSAKANSKPGEGFVVWQTPYARRLYYNPQYDFSTDVNPNARGLWFEAAKADNKDKWIDQASKATRSKL